MFYYHHLLTATAQAPPLSTKVRLEYLVVYRIYSALLNRGQVGYALGAKVRGRVSQARKAEGTSVQGGKDMKMRPFET